MSLNDLGDTVFLIDATGTVVDSFSYTTSSEGAVIGPFNNCEIHIKSKPVGNSGVPNLVGIRIHGARWIQVMLQFAKFQALLLGSV